jgi:hypothetical protein
LNVGFEPIRMEWPLAPLPSWPPGETAEEGATAKEGFDSKV